MAELKTRPTDASAEAFLQAVPDPGRREDALALDGLLRRLTRESPVLWGDTLVGYGAVRLRYASGREVDWFRIGFSPRKADLVLYLTPGLERHAALLTRLGRHRLGKGCLYLKRLKDANPEVLDALLRATLEG